MELISEKKLALDYSDISLQNLSIFHLSQLQGKVEISKQAISMLLIL